MVPEDELAVTADLAYENLLEPVGTPTVHPLCRGLAAKYLAFRMAYCQKHVDAEGLYGNVHKRGGDILKVQHPSPEATSSPLGGKGRCSAAEEGEADGEKASECLPLTMSSWPTAEEGKNLERTKDSDEITNYENHHVLQFNFNLTNNKKQMITE